MIVMLSDLCEQGEVNNITHIHCRPITVRRLRIMLFPQGVLPILAGSKGTELWGIQSRTDQRRQIQRICSEDILSTTSQGEVNICKTIHTVLR